MGRTFYVTTPIYYVNDLPHIGTAYTTVAADVLARFHRLKGEEVFFLTGTDEHGQHVERAAERNGVSPQEWADRMVVHFTDVWKALNISNDFFIRTTSPRHTEVARDFIGVLFEKGDIYKDAYEGWYCVPDESFWLPSQLVDGKCPQCGREVEMLKEDNYFFRLSAYAEKLLAHIEANPAFIQPEMRRNEVLSFIRQGLEDQSISRKTLTWGIPLPFDESQVMYVWFDALLNYISAIDYDIDDAKFNAAWPANWHLIGKEILRFHAIIWPAMLMAAGLPLPQHVYAHGWLTVEGEKMSKSKGNAISPYELIDEYGVDAYRFYFMREFSFGYDGNFSRETMTGRYNSELANDLGNLVSRVLAMVHQVSRGYRAAAGAAGGDGRRAGAGRRRRLRGDRPPARAPGLRRGLERGMVLPARGQPLRGRDGPLGPEQGPGPGRAAGHRPLQPAGIPAPYRPDGPALHAGVGAARLGVAGRRRSPGGPAAARFRCLGPAAARRRNAARHRPLPAHRDLREVERAPAWDW